MKELFCEKEIANPLSDLISDNIYELLNANGLINETSVRDYNIKKKFQLPRNNRKSACEAIGILKSDYPYLQFDTLRKIVYKNFNN